MAKPFYIKAASGQGMPIWETITTGFSGAINNTNLTTYFSVTNSNSYNFAWNSSKSRFQSNNNSVSSSTCTTTWTALQDATVSFTYGVSSESNYDKFTLTVAGTTVASAISGTSSSTYTKALTKGQTIVLKYVKDGSVDRNDDCGYISNFTINTTITTQQLTKYRAPKTANLPSGYTQLEYIEGTGTQYINLGFKPNNNTRLILDIDIASQASYPTALLGARDADTSTSKSFIMFIMTATGFRTDFNSSTVNADMSTLGRFVIDKNKNITTINGKAFTNTAGTFQSAYDLCLLTENDAGGADTRITKGKIYESVLYDNGSLIRDCIPCSNDAGIAGLWDIKNQVFYRSAGTEDFIAGPAITYVARPVIKAYQKVNGEIKTITKAYKGVKNFIPRELPEGYTQIEYIESGGTQYVDTGFKPNNNTRVVMDYNLISGKPPVMFGAMDSWVSKGFAYISNEAMDTLTICYGANFYTPTANAAGRHIIDANKNVFSLDGMVVQTCTEVTFQSNYNLILFGYNNGGTVTTKNTIVYIHSCQIYDNGTLIRDYVPCTNQTGVGGLYDLVENKFYTNAGTGVFTASTSECISVARLCFEAN